MGRTPEQPTLNGMFVFLVLFPILVFSHPKHNSTHNESTQVSGIVHELLTTEGYNSKVRPGADSEEPLIVRINIFITEIYRISEADMEFSMSLYLRQKWLDERMAYYPKYNGTITLNYNQFNKVWSPDLFIRNLKSGHLHDITVPNRLIRLYPNGTFLYSQRLSVTLSCDMLLERYPMDNQTCYINFGSYAYTLDDMVLEWDKTVSNPVVVNEKISFPKFDFIKASHRDCAAAYASTGSYPCIEAHFHLERRLKSYILYIYLPSLLVVVLSWVSFWIDLNAVPARISLGILTILTVVTQSVGVNRNLPTVSFTKAIDVWMVSCLVFVFAAFLEFSLVNVLARRYKNWKPSGRRESFRECQVVHPNKETDLIPLNPTSQQSPQSVDGEHAGHVRRRPNAEFPAQPQQQTTERNAGNALQKSGQRFKRRNPALAVDIISRFLFPFLFMVFNAVYWPMYFQGFQF